VSASAQAAFAKGIASSYYRPGQYGAIITAQDLSLGQPYLACPDDQCVFLPNIST
jgi:hypothetical protein